MKKAISLLVMAAVVIGLSGCLDPQDGTAQKVPAKAIPKVISNIAL